MKAKSLPFPQLQAFSKALSLVPFTAELNQEILVIKNLMLGQYNLSIDGQSIASFSASDLARGINLAIDENTPQYQQALEVSHLNEQRRQLQIQLRDAAFTFYTSGLYKAKKVDINDPLALKYFLDKHMESLANTQPYKYHKMKAENYLKIQSNKQKILKDLETLHKQIYKVNKPKLHHYKLTKQLN